MFPRTQGEKKHIMAFKISVPTQEEYDAHMLAIVYLKLRQLQQKINGQIGASDGSLSNSMMGGGLGIQGAAVTRSAGQFFGTKNYDQVYGMIRQSMDEAGLDRDSIFNQLRMKMSKVEMDNALDFLNAKLVEADLLALSQVVSFTSSLMGENIKLLEVTPEVANGLETGDVLTMRGEEGDNSVLCSHNKILR